VKNLSPHRKFKGPQGVKASFRPYYRQTWPPDLPEDCQICGTKFRQGFNLRIVSGYAGRILKKVAYAIILPSMLLPFAISHFFPDLIVGRAGGFAFLFFMFFPPAILGFLSAVMPRSRFFECKKCGWNRDYKLLPPPTFGTEPEKP
jgi:hypothetical protein